MQPRLGENSAERIDVVPNHSAPEESTLHNGRASPHEWIIEKVSRMCEGLDEEPGELRLEARTVRNFME